MEKIAIKQNVKTLIYGIGNVSRQDDGLGIRLVEMLEKTDLSDKVKLEANYQLNVEDALQMLDFDQVVFVDASVKKSAQAPYEFDRVEPAGELSFSTHAMSVPAIVKMCITAYGKCPEVYLLSMPGYEWDLKESLTEGAKNNLNSTYNALLEVLNCTKLH